MQGSIYNSSRELSKNMNLRGFLIARSIQAENGGFSSSPSTECKNLLYLLDMSSKVYKMNFLDKIDKKNNWWNEIYWMKLIKMKLIQQNW